MTHRLRWCGIDYGETIMNPLTLHQSAVIRDIYSELGRAEEADERVQRYYRLRNAWGPASTPPHLLVRDLKQYARDSIYADVFDNDPDAVERYKAKEVEGFGVPEGVADALAMLRDKGIPAAVVSESGSLTAVQTIARYLQIHAFGQYFDEIIAPAGRFSVDGALIDATFVGATKKAGTIYEKIREYVQTTKGIPSSAAAIVGDDPHLDVAQARPHGFVTVQYVGVIDRGGSEAADFAMKHWREFEKMF